MLKDRRLTLRLQQWLIAVVFWTVHLFLRSVSLHYWMPHYGLWFGGVLLLPRRFWPALFVSNVAAVAPVAYACFDEYGWLGSLLHLIPIAGFAMLVIWPLRRQLPGIVSGKSIVEWVTARQLVVMLGCFFAYTVLSSIDSTAQLILTLKPGDDPSLIGVWSARFFLGSYIGCLILVPLALAIHEAVRQADSWRDLVQRMGRSRLLLEGVVLGLACVGLLAAMGAGMAGDMWRQVARMALFLPVAWMAVRYGWQGAAVGGTAASIGIMLTMVAPYDSATIHAQTLMAFCLTLLLPLGAKITLLNEQERQLATDHMHVRQAAQREIYQGELRLRRGMEMQAEVHGHMVEVYGRLLERVRDMLPPKELDHFRRLMSLVRRCTSSVQETFLPAPWKWPRLALLMALRGGAIAETLEECGVSFDPHVSERVALLTPDVKWTLYRLACEAVAYTLMQAPATPCIRLYVRVAMVGPMRDIPWAMMVVVGDPEPPKAPPVLIALPHSSNLLLSRLGAMGLDLAGMRDRASLYQGRLRSNRRWQRVSLSLLDAPSTKLDAGHTADKGRRSVFAA